MPIFKNYGETTTLFLFSQVIDRFGVPKQIVTNHGTHFENTMMKELTNKLGFRHDQSSPYYTQYNGQVEVVNKVINTMLQRIVNKHRTNWHLMLFPTL